jgi:hypothetical protein
MDVSTDKTKLEILLICDYHSSSAATIVDHISAFEQYSEHNIHTLNSLGNLPNELDINKFHIIVIHYSICIVSDYYISPSAREKIRNFQGLKVLYIQDDYRWIYKTLATIDYMKMHAIFGLAEQKIVDQVYIPERIPTVKRRETVLTGYVTDKLINLPQKRYSARTIDVGYRARKVSPWLGVHAQQKWTIGERFSQDAVPHNLTCDISYREEDRIYGDNWFSFLSNCKSVLGTESGASICDFTGEIQIQVEAYLLKHPHATFEKVSALFLNEHDGKIMINAISPRCFEAAALGTLMVLYEGEYSGILKPFLHYVPLARDHHNLPEVIEYIKNEKKSNQIIKQAYHDIVLNPDYNYRKMIQLFDDLINEEVPHFYQAIWNPYSQEAFNQIAEEHKLKRMVEDIIQEKMTSDAFNFTQNAARLTIRILSLIKRQKPIKKLKYFITKKIKIFNLLLQTLKNSYIHR